MLNPNAPSFYLRRPRAPANFRRPGLYPPPPPPPLPPHPVLGFPYGLRKPILLPPVDVFVDKFNVTQKVLSLPSRPRPPPPCTWAKTCSTAINEVLPPASSMSDTNVSTERAALGKNITSFSIRGPRCGAQRRKVTKVWMAKGSRLPRICSTYKAPDFDDADPRRRPTTVMIKNLPNRVSRENLIDILDQHCVEMNERKKQNFSSEYDFVYLPMDFGNNCNLGYGFVNFTTREGALAFFNTYQSHKWEIYHSKKVCQVSSARLQGKAALVERFKNTTFHCHSDDYLPVQFTPPRNGSTSLPPPILVGSLGLNRETERRVLSLSTSPALPTRTV